MFAPRFAPLTRWIAPLALPVTVAACGGEPAADTTDGVVRQPIPRGVDPAMVTWRSDGVIVPSKDSLQKTPGYVVDSLFTPEEDLRRFQATVVGPVPTQLSGGAASTDALIREYWALLSTGDTLSMSPLVVSRGEYAYLYFPGSVEATSGMPPAIGWELIVRQSGRGLTRALRIAQVGPSVIKSVTCSDTPRVSGKNTIYGPCGVVITRDGTEQTVWVVKSLIERDGVHKLFGLQNELSGG